MKKKVRVFEHITDEEVRKIAAQFCHVFPGHFHVVEEIPRYSLNCLAKDGTPNYREDKVGDIVEFILKKINEERA